MMESIAETVHLIQVNIDKVSNVDKSVTDITTDAVVLGEVTARDKYFANSKGKQVIVSVEDFTVLGGKPLTGRIIRSSDNEGEYIVGCRMPEDCEAIRIYVSQNYSE